MTTPLASAPNAGQPFSPFPSALLDEGIQKEINLLTKTGGLHSTLVTTGIMFAGALVFSVFGALSRPFSQAEAGQAARDIQPLAGPLGHLVAPIVSSGALRPIFFVFGGLCALLGLITAYLALSTSTQGTFNVRCPRCRKQFEFSTRHRRSFAFVCDGCHAPIAGSEAGYSEQHVCEYCGYESYGVRKAKEACSCGLKPGAKRVACRVCGKQIPRHVSFCEHCQAWLWKDESVETGLLAGDQVVHAVERFGPRSALAYSRRLVERLKGWAPHLRDGLDKAGDLKKAPLYGSGGAYFSLEPRIHELRKCVIAVQQLHVTRGAADVALAREMAETINALAQDLGRIRATGNLQKKHDAQYAQLIEESQATVAAAVAEAR